MDEQYALFCSVCARSVPFPTWIFGTDEFIAAPAAAFEKLLDELVFECEPCERVYDNTLQYVFQAKYNLPTHARVLVIR